MTTVILGIEALALDGSDNEGDFVFVNLFAGLKGKEEEAIGGEEEERWWASGRKNWTVRDCCKEDKGMGYRWDEDVVRWSACRPRSHVNCCVKWIRYDQR